MTGQADKLKAEKEGGGTGFSEAATGTNLGGKKTRKKRAVVVDDD